MDRIRHGTATALWQDLIREGEQRRHLMLGEELEAYLVFALMRHLGDAQIGARIMALEWLHASANPQHPGGLRDVGDRCLLIAGLFPRLLRRRRVERDYYVDIGRSAYASAAARAPGCERPLFAQLAEAFRSLVDVLTAVRPGALPQPLPICDQAEILHRHLH